MKKLLLILIFVPITNFGQDIRIFCTSDLLINQLLENTVSFIKQKNAHNKNFRFYLTNKESSINWNQEKFSKWQILDLKTKRLNE